MSLKYHLSYSAVGAFGTKFINIIFLIIMARLLSPYEFGLFSILNIFGVFALVFVDMGFGAALIHIKKTFDAHFDTAFIINIILGFIFSVFMYLSSNQIAIFFNESRLSILAKYYSLIFFLDSIAIVPVAILQKRCDFKQISKADIFSLLISSLIGIYLAYSNFGIWSFIWFKISNSFFRSIFMMLFSKWYFKLNIKLNVFFDLWNFIKYLICSRTLDYVVNRLDQFFVGKLSGSASLGIYGTTMKLLNLPCELSGGVLNRVLLSRYSLMQDDQLTTRDIHLRISSLVFFITFPIFSCLWCMSDLMIYYSFGSKWLDMSIFLKLLSFRAFLSPLGVLNGSIYLAHGETKMQLYVGLFVKTIHILAVIVGSYWGVFGIVYGLLIVSFITVVPNFYFPFKIIDLKFKDFLYNLSPYFFSGVISVAIVIGLRFVVGFNIVSIKFFILLLFAFIFLYLAILVLFGLRPDKNLHYLLEI